jgi:hypothetical protein
MPKTKERTATEKLMLALEGINTALTIMESIHDGEKRAELIKRAKEYREQASDALTTIQFHLGLLK